MPVYGVRSRARARVGAHGAARVRCGTDCGRPRDNVMSATNLTADTVAALLVSPETRIGTIEALEAHIGAHDEQLALVAIATLSELMALDVVDVEPALFQRIGWLRGRMVTEAADAPAMWASACKDGRFEAIFGSTVNVLAQIVGKAPETLGQDDALSWACALAMDGPAYRHGGSLSWNAAFGDAFTFIRLMVELDPMGM